MKKVIAYTLDPEVIAKVDSLAESLGMSNSALVNMQLRVAMGMIDEATSEFLNRGMTRTRVTDIGMEDR